MTNEEKICFLNRYRISNQRLEDKLSEFQLWNDRLHDLTSGCVESVEEVQSAINPIKEQILTIQMQLSQKIQELCDEKEEIQRAIATVKDETLKLLLEKRYLESKTWKVISSELNFSYVHICRLHLKALEVVRL